jgi:putative Mg2+ transporter-C (MgtC) family protein
MSHTEFTLRLLTALVLGLLIGLERQWHRRLADLKVTALVCMGASLFTGAHEFFPWRGDDPTRIAAQVVVGVGFLGAGLLWRERGEVRGITTAATVWCSAAVGTVVGTGALTQAALATAVIVLGNTLLRPVGRLLHYRMSTDSMSAMRRVRVTYDLELEGEVRELVYAFAEHPSAELQRNVETSAEHGDAHLEFDVELDGRDGERALRRLSDDLRALGATRVETERVG